MTIKEFFHKLFSPFVLWNVGAMAALVVVAVVGVSIWLAFYTHHGESVAVPDLQGMSLSDAQLRTDDAGLLLCVADSGYNKSLPAGAVLMQNPEGGEKVKAGRTVYVTINSGRTPTIALPDLIDNSSYREAHARLAAMGFTMSEPIMVNGERDWVYGIMAGKRGLNTGDRVSTEQPLTLVIGNGQAPDLPLDSLGEEPVSDDDPEPMKFD